MLPKTRRSLNINTYDYETHPLVKPTGFREYDARWLFGEEINLMGVQALGMGLGQLIHEIGERPDIIVGHDYRQYSSSIKMALANGLIAAGMRVRDIGLALSPMAYFAQFALDVPCVAMVTASHNDNGWTGVKMGVAPPLTFGPDEMARLKAIVLENAFADRPGGGYAYHQGMPEAYLADLLARPRLGRKLKVVAACGNGTAGAFAPKALEALGCEVVSLDAELDHSFPRHNPNPEDVAMLRAIGDAVRESGADIGFGFDGDGDRCGVVDDKGEAIFADKVGVLLARDLSKRYPGARFVVDVKSTSLYATDPVLSAQGAHVEYWKTGHSHMKLRCKETGALAGFEKSGHYFFNPPIGRGYDDALVSAFAVCDMLDRVPGWSISDLRRGLPATWTSPTMSPRCADETKYRVVEEIVRRFEAMRSREEAFAGQPIRDLITINGVRIVTEDGSWGLVRASSNKPELVVVVESPVSEKRMREMFEAIDGALRQHPGIGAYNQTL